MDFAMSIDKLDMANSLRSRLLTFRKLYQKVKQHGFGFEKIVDFAMDSDNHKTSPKTIFQVKN